MKATGFDSRHSRECGNPVIQRVAYQATQYSTGFRDKPGMTVRKYVYVFALRDGPINKKSALIFAPARFKQGMSAAGKPVRNNE